MGNMIMGALNELKHIFHADGPILHEDALLMDQVLVGLGTVALLFLPIILYRELRDRGEGDDGDDQEEKEARGKQRRLSFTSVGLGLGSFPPDANVKEPIINAAVYFDDCPSKEDVAKIIVQPLLDGYERLSTVPDLVKRVQRASSHGDDINASDMIRTFDFDGTEEELHKDILDHCQDALGEGRDDLPWWEIVIFRNVNEKEGGPSACMLRVHHVIGDGLALLAAFEKLLTTEDGRPISSPVSSMTGRAGQKSGSSFIQKKKKKGLFSTIWSVIEATGHVLTLGATKYDDDTAFSKMNHSKMKHSGKREAVIFPTIPLDYIKNLKSAAGVTVNDILMTAISQAIHDYCQKQGDTVLASKGSALRCRGLLPVGFPRDHDELRDRYAAMRNIWCMVSCDLGVGIHTGIRDRLAHVHAETQEMKDKPRAYMQLAMQNKVGPYVPVSMGQQTVFDTFSRHSLVLTNVPGPSEECLFAGKKIKGVQLFFDNLLTQVDLISYAGKVYGNIVFDAEELPDSGVFGVFYVEALVELGKCLDVDVPAEVVAMAAASRSN